MPPAQPERFLMTPAGVAFIGPVNADFVAYRIQRWKSYHPDIRRAMESRAITPAAVEDFSPDLRARYAGPERQAGVSPEQFIVQGRTENALLAIEAPGTLLNRAEHVASFDRLIARALDHDFGFSSQPGFRRAQAEDLSAPLRRMFEDRPLITRSFCVLWAAQSAAEQDRKDVAAARQMFPHSWKWVAANTPSARHGFSMQGIDINMTDLAERTPLDNLTVPIGNRHKGLSPLELSSMLRAGADPFRVSDATDKSLTDELIARKDTVHLEIVAVEAARTESPIRRFVTPSAKASLEVYADCELRQNRKEAFLGLVARLPDNPRVVFSFDWQRRPKDSSSAPGI